MRIAIWWDQESWGGVDTHLLTLLKNWPDINDRFVIFYNSDNQGMKRISTPLAALDQVEKVSFEVPSVFLPTRLSKVARYFLLPLRFLLMKRRAQRILASHGKFDVLFVDNGGYPGAWGSLAALWAGSALGFHTRMLLVHHEAMTRGPLRQNFESLMDFGVQNWATDLVAVSRATRDTLIERRGFYTSTLNPIRVVHNGVDFPSETNDKLWDLREHLDIPVDSFVVGMVARLERYKGQEDLILALECLKPERYSRVVVVFVGGGQSAEEQRLKKISQKLGVASQIRFVGYVEGSICKLIQQFDLLAMLTKDFEGFGLTIAEAMSAKVPAMATLVGAVPEFVTREIAYLVQPEAPDEIAETLVQIMDDSEEVKKRVDKAHLHISKYSGEVMAKKFHRLLLASGS